MAVAEPVAIRHDGAIPDRLAEIEARLERLEHVISDLHLPDSPSRLPATAADTVLPAGLLSIQPDAIAWLTLAGRTLMVLGGAYLLRAITESGRLSASVGVVIGLGYALAWLGAADRAGMHGDRKLSGAFHGLTAVLIGVPLLLEASTRFRILSPETGAGALTMLTLLSLIVAWHGRLQSVATVAIVGSIGATLVLAARTGHPVPSAAALVVIGAATIAVADLRQWPWLKWPPALAADLVVMALTSRALVTPPLDDPRTVTALQVLLVVTYAAPAVWRTLVRGHPARPFDVVQTALALAFGVGGAWVTLQAQESSAGAIIASAMALGAAGAYVAAFAVIESREGQGGTFVAYLTFGAALVFAASAVVASGTALAVLFALGAVILISASGRLAQPAMMLHGVFFAFAAAVVSQLLTVSTAVWMTAGPWPSAAPIQAVVLATAAACLGIASRQAPAAGRFSHWSCRAAGVTLATLVVYTGGAVVVRLLAVVLDGAPIAPGVLASVRTVTLAALALVAAVPRTGAGLNGLRWLVYPLLLVGGLKLLVDDFPRSGAVTLFPALAAYGAALILAPRLARGRRQAA